MGICTMAFLGGLACGVGAVIIGIILAYMWNAIKEEKE